MFRSVVQALTIFGVGFLGVSLGLFVPKHIPNTCVQGLHLGLTATIAQNCDSPGIATSANDLRAYLTEDLIWISRPTYIFTVAAVRALFSWALVPTAAFLLNTFPELTNSPYVLGRIDLLSTYLAAFLVNGMMI